jgi:hypothetical protein
MKALIKTKSNYKNLNGQWLEVIEAVGKRISCKHNDNGNNVTVDFTLSEIAELSYASK